jgi:methanogenic corrinoid protein MtbC1
MVSDFFEMAGFDTWYLGASTPTDAVAQALAERQPDVFAVSATMSDQLPAVRELVRAARACTDRRRTRILVGGYPFNRAPDLWRRMDADGSAADAAEAVNLAQRLCADADTGAETEVGAP